jgi:hypothetical protein
LLLKVAGVGKGQPRRRLPKNTPRVLRLRLALGLKVARKRGGCLPGADGRALVGYAAADSEGGTHGRDRTDEFASGCHLRTPVFKLISVGRMPHAGLTCVRESWRP